MTDSSASGRSRCSSSASKTLGAPRAPRPFPETYLRKKALLPDSPKSNCMDSPSNSRLKHSTSEAMMGPGLEDGGNT